MAPTYFCFEDSFEKFTHFYLQKDIRAVLSWCQWDSETISSIYVSSFLFLISDVKKVNRKSETKRYSEIFREFDNLDLSLISS